MTGYNKNVVFNTCIYAICFFVGLISRIFYCIKYPVPIRDAYKYKLFIEQWNISNRIPEDGIYPPLGMYLLRIPSRFFYFDVLKGGILVNMIFGLCLILLAIKIVFLLKRNDFEALLTGLVVATHPTLVYYSCNLLRETIYLCFVCLMIVGVIKYYERGNKKDIAIIALYSACAYLCRHEGIELLFIACVIIAANIKQKSIANKTKDIFFCCAIFSICFMGVSYLIGVPLDYYRSILREFQLVFGR